MRAAAANAGFESAVDVRQREHPIGCSTCRIERAIQTHLVPDGDVKRSFVRHEASERSG